MATGLHIARLITLGLAAGGLVYVFRIVRLLLPAYPAVALTATALTAVMPAFVNVSALVHNDALAFLAAGGLLHAAFRILVDGLSRGPLIAAAIWASVACLTRFASLLVLAPALLAVFVAPLLHEQGGAARRLWRGALACGAILGAVVLTSGWFYLRNYWLYGDLTGGKELFEILHRRARKPAIYYVFSFEQWLTLHDHLWARLAAGKVMKGATVYVGRCFSLIALVGFAKAIFDARRHLRRSLWRDPRAVALAISLLSFLCVTLPIFEFYSRGGGITARYFFPVLWVPMTILAVGLHAVKTPALPAAGVLMASLLSVATLYLYFLLLVKTLWAEGFGYFMAFAGAALGLVLLLDPVRALHRRIGDAAAEPQQDAAVPGGAAQPTSALPGGATQPTSALPGGAAQPTSDAPPPGESATVSP
jgi:hypothetical protein